MKSCIQPGVNRGLEKRAYPCMMGCMKKPLPGVWLRSVWHCFVVLAIFSIGTPAMRAWERGDVLEAIHQVENPNDTLRIGPRGELGPFQFRPVVWCRYTQKPFALAADRAEALAVAEMHYEWIKRGLVRNGREVTPYSIGLAWNAGLCATLNGRASENSRQYATRVANLVEQDTKANVAAPAAALGGSAPPSTAATAL